jgi:hypothetical protein
VESSFPGVRVQSDRRRVVLNASYCPASTSRATSIHRHARGACRLHLTSVLTGRWSGRQRSNELACHAVQARFVVVVFRMTCVCWQELKDDRLRTEHAQ